MRAWRAVRAAGFAAALLALGSPAAADPEAALAAAPHSPLLFETLDGAPLEVSLAPGERALLVHFWASWCPDCIEELPTLDAAAAGCAASGVRVLLVNVGETAATAGGFVAEHQIRGAIALDPKGAVWRRRAPPGLPANLMWTAAGLRTDAGPRDKAAWARALEALGCGE